MNHLRPFSNIVYLRVTKQQSSELQMRVKKGILIGYAMKTREYTVRIAEDIK